MNNKSKKSRKQPASAPAPSILPSRKPLCWKNRSLQIHLGREARDVSIAAILGRDGKCWLKRENESEWWKLYLRGPDGTSPAYSNTYADYQGAIKEKRPGGRLAIRLRWTLRLTRGQPAFVEVLISESPAPGLSFWEFEAQLPEGWRVVRLDFPVLSIPAAPGELRMAAPVGYGHEYDLAPR